MYYPATFGILVVALLAYCNSTPPEDLTFPVVEAVFENGQRCFTDTTIGGNIKLTKDPTTNDGYVIQETTPLKVETDRKFDLKNFHTMIRNTVVLDTNIGSLRLQLPNVEDAHRLFNLAAPITPRTKTYSYRLNAVHKYRGESGVPKYGLSISGYTPEGKASSDRYVIHTGSTEYSGPIAPASRMQPFLLWTASDFNYCDYDSKSIVVTLPNPVEGANPYNYYLVVFADQLELARWKVSYGNDKFRSSRIPKAVADPEIISYFVTVYVSSDNIGKK